MKKKFRVGLFGISLESVNYGVTALAYTQISILKKIEEECGTTFEYLIFADDSNHSIERAKLLLQTNNIIPKYIVRFKTGLNGLVKLRRDIKTCDLIIDLTYGDSFSDIYGFKSFLLYSIPKLMAIHTNTPLVIAPQTIGPFYGKWTKSTAKYLLSHSNYIFVRDNMSLECAASLSKRNDLVETSDLAMQLPYEKKINPNYVKGKINVGLNISLLLWEKDNTNSPLSLTLSYKELTKALLSILMAEGYIVHLIAHVYDKRAFTEYLLAEKLCAEYKNTILAPSFIDPIDAKNYIAGLDCFIGARMHATIGAFSSGIPVIPIAYSRKFEGLYRALGYNHCVDCNTETVESAVKKIAENLNNLDGLKSDCELAFAKAVKKNEKYYIQLKNICSNL